MGTIPVLTPAGMRAWERATWAAGVREEDVIARVGDRVAAAALRLGGAGPFLLLAGKGHNGDDVRAAARALRGRDVTLVEIGDPALALPGVASALGRRPSLVVDGLFGTGLNRPLSGDWARLAGLLNSARARVLAVDVPSGLNALDGTSWGAVVRADETMAVGGVKTGLLASAATPWVGRVSVAEDVGLVPWEGAGIPDGEIAGEWGGCEPEGWVPMRERDVHKGRMGHVMVLGGSVGYHGAEVMAVRGALGANPGLVTAWTHPGCYVPVAAQLASAMVWPWDAVREVPWGVTCVVVGPGMAGEGVAEAWRDRVRGWWDGCPATMVVDASALEWIGPGKVRAVAPRVITPHPGEAARLLGMTAAAVQADRSGAWRRLAGMFEGAWVVLKGHGTIVGRAGGRPWWNSTGNPWLAQGGSGDVLAGYLGGLLAQPCLVEDAGRTVRHGVREHGAAADRLQARGTGWTTEDLAREVGRGGAGAGGVGA